MDIRIGNQTAMAAGSPLLPFEYAIAHGFDAFEWFPDKNPSGEGWDMAGLGRLERRYILERALAANVSLSVHAPLAGDPLRPETARHFHESIRFAADIGAVLLNLHLTVPTGDVAQSSGLRRKPEACATTGAEAGDARLPAPSPGAEAPPSPHGGEGTLECYAAGLAPVLQACGEQRLRLAIENTVHTGPEHFNALFAILRRRFEDSETTAVCGMCFDLGHANLYAGTRNDYLAYMDRLDAQVPILHVHMHENYGDYDSHLPIFTGPAKADPSGVAGFFRRLRARHYQGAVILEQWPDPPSLLDYSRGKLLEIARASG